MTWNFQTDNCQCRALIKVIISISLNCKYVELIAFYNIQQWQNMACTEYSEYIIFLSKFWIKNLNFSCIFILLNVFLIPVARKMDSNKLLDKNVRAKLYDSVIQTQ